MKLRKKCPGHNGWHSDLLKRKVRNVFHAQALEHPLYTIPQVKEESQKVKKNDIVNYLQEKSPDVEVTDLSDNALSVIGTKSQIYQQIYRAK